MQDTVDQAPGSGTGRSWTRAEMFWQHHSSRTHASCLAAGEAQFRVSGPQRPARGALMSAVSGAERDVAVGSGREGTDCA